MGFYKSFFFYGAILSIGPILFLYQAVRFQSHDPDALRIMTSSSFVSSDGPGPALAQLFFETHGLKIHWLAGGNGGVLLQRLKMRSSRDQPDLVMGLDQFSKAEALKWTSWWPLPSLREVKNNSLVPEGAWDSYFLPYDWGPLTFIYKGESVSPPGRLTDLLDSRFSDQLVLQDPRLSTPGLHFVLWVLTELGESSGWAFLTQLKEKSVDRLSPSWSSSYSYFLSRPEGYVFSYFSSLLYHEKQASPENFQAVRFQQRHPVHVEYAGVLKNCSHCSEAQLFLKFLHSKAAQEVLMNRNYMFPVRTDVLDKNHQEWLQSLPLLDPSVSESLFQRKQQWIQKWKSIFY